jgi:hypothetical protein
MTNQSENLTTDEVREAFADDYVAEHGVGWHTGDFEEAYQGARDKFDRWLAADRVATLTELLTVMSTVMHENEYKIRAVPQAVILDVIERYKKDGGLK